jgi:acyl-CoA synthetase (AMP-forming)/AMP-acid ligase II
MVARQSVGEDGWLHTGDLGQLDREGLLHVEGRTKELIVTGGENVAPLEVERVLASHPAVVEAAVAGVPDPQWGEAIVAFLVLRSTVAPDELLAWCRERLAPFKVPKSFRTVAELPRNQTGKLMRDRLDSLASAPP